MNDVKEKVQLAGWIAAAVAFVALALSNFGCPYIVHLAAWSLLVAGAALFWCERVKSTIVIALAGLLFDEPIEEFDYDDRSGLNL